MPEPNSISARSAVARDQVESGVAALWDAIEAFNRLAYTRGLARGLEELAIAAERQGHRATALRLAGGAAGLRQRTGLVPGADEVARITPVIDRLRAGEDDRVWRNACDTDEASVLAIARGYVLGPSA